jgi:molecular chaperone DnaK (HSP70)
MVLLVGGFAESKIVQDRIKEAFDDKKIIIPGESGLVVLKGAVLFGHNPKVIKSRVSKYTYGVELQRPFDADIHPQEFKFLNADNRLWCRNLFEVFIHAGETVPVDRVTKKVFTVTTIDITEGAGIYASENVNPTYTYCGHRLL